MKTLNSKHYIIVSLLFISTVKLVLSQGQPPIEIERVKKDLINSEFNIIPVNFIEKSGAAKFTMLYIDNVCVAHLAFRDYLTESFMKSSMIAIYQFNGKNWALKKTSPYYYSISLVDKIGKVFLSANEFCEPNASCSSFFELSKLDSEMKMMPLVQVDGFDKYNYLLRLLILNRNEDVLKCKGDTISRNVTLSNIKSDDKGIFFLKTTTIKILKGVISDSLITNTLNVETQQRIKK